MMPRRDWKAEIRMVEEQLRRWDPIGVIADLEADGLLRSEYDGYAPHIVGMLQRGCEADDLATHLEHCRTVTWTCAVMR